MLIQVNTYIVVMVLDSINLQNFHYVMVGKYVITFGVDISSFVHIDNKGKGILILGKGPRQELDDTTLTAEAQYSINFSRSNKKFCLSLHYNESNSFLFLNATKIYQFKTKNSEITKHSFCLENIPGNFSANNMKEKRG